MTKRITEYCKSCAHSLGYAVFECDECGKTIRIMAEVPQEKEPPEGWIKEGNNHYCEDCKDETEEES